MKLKEIFIIVLISVLITYFGVKWFGQPSNTTVVNNSTVSDQPAYDRVMATRTIRCAYAIWAPFITVDPNTRKLSGVAYDLFEQVGKILNFKVEWTEEIPFSQVVDNLKSGRNDVMCMTLWPSGSRAQALDFTDAVDYMGAFAFVRADDTRFDGDLSKINDNSITISVIEGDFTKSIPDEDFPNAKQHSLGMDSDGAQLFMALGTRKADVTFTDPFLAADFNKSNPNSVRQVANVPPVRVFGDAFAVYKGETKLRDMLNTVLRQMNQGGFTRKTLDKYLGDRKGLYYYPAKPYEN